MCPCEKHETLASLQPYLHQEDFAFLGRSNKVFHLSGVHGKGFLAQHILPSLEEKQPNSPVLCVQHSKVHDVCRDKQARLILKQ